MRNRTIKRRTRSRNTKTRRHRGGFGENPIQSAPALAPPVAPAPPPVPVPEPVKPCGWWGALFGCPKTTGGRRKKHKKSVSFQR